MTFNISEFIRVNRVYFIWAVFMGLLYLFRNLFGLVFITFIMCFIVSGITHRLRRKYHFNRRTVVISTYLLFLLSVIAFLVYVPPKILSETITFTEQLPKSINSVGNWLNNNLEKNEVIAPLLPQIKEALFPETLVVSVWNVVREMLERGLHYIGWFFLAMLFSFLIMFDLPELSKGMRRLRFTRLAESYRETADSV